jgi:hypothetical protein
MNRFPAWADQQAQAILDQIAHRLLAEFLELDPVDRAAWLHDHGLEGAPDAPPDQAAPEDQPNQR